MKNTIDIIKTKLSPNNKYIDLYKNFNNEELILVLSTLHFELNRLLELLNKKLPTKNFYNYFPANSSRELIFIIEKIDEIKDVLIDTDFSFEIDSYYLSVINYCKKILKPKAGSSIDRNTDKIEIYINKPIFIKK